MIQVKHLCQICNGIIFRRSRWLHNLSIDNNYYAIGAAISLIIFVITSAISLAVYVFSPAYRQEGTYR